MMTTFIFKSAVQDGKGQAGHIRYRTNQMQDRTDAGQGGCRIGRMLYEYRTDAGQDESRTELMQDRSDVERMQCSTVRQRT